MESNSNIRKRRQERIKHIVDRGKDEFKPAHPPDRGYPASTPVRPAHDALPPEHRPSDPRLHDPEYVWKHRDSIGWAPSYRFYGNDSAERETGRRERWLKPPGFGRLRGQIIMCAVLFALVWGLFQLDTPWADRSRQAIRTALTEDLDFAAAAASYSRLFHGYPSLIPAFMQRGDQSTDQLRTESANFYPPVLGVVRTSFTEAKQGVGIQTRTGAPVSALDSGIVTFVGNTDQWGLTIMVRHANQYVSIYGGVAGSLVRENDWVKGGAQLGTVAGLRGERSSELFFAVKKADKFINPADVISFD